MIESFDAVGAYRERMRTVQARLAAHAAQGPPPGLTDPDPGASERWEAGQVWAHLAEFTPYWMRQIERVVEGWTAQVAEGGSHAAPVPFGRTRADGDRIAAIERDRHEEPAALLERVRGDITAAADALAALPREAWAAVGLHPTLGPMEVPAIVERFVVGHLEEHADQLDLLRDRA